ncbi:helix-turn-helix domain-containing protein [Escherichia coli]|uniref:helix-turn-helix domain-containing protein n=1 Tax=Enterobacteriaceae TaxID=543 RepID=UPI0026C1AD7C
MRRTNHRNLVNVGILSGRIPLISLVQFIAVAEHLNFRHAAKALGISQSSVSARVKALEDNLGVLLFERHARGVRLTASARHSHSIVNKHTKPFSDNNLQELSGSVP